MRRLARALRVVLCAVLLLGLLPGSHELVENLVHLAHDGHLAHSETHEVLAEAEHCEADAEHGCTPLSHSCECCVSLAGLPALPEPVVLPALRPRDAPRHAHIGRSPPPHTGEPPFHPPRS